MEEQATNIFFPFLSLFFFLLPKLHVCSFGNNQFESKQMCLLTALHLSSAAGYEGTVDILLRSYKADNNIKDCFGKKAEDYALKPAVRQNFGLEPA